MSNYTYPGAPQAQQVGQTPLFLVFDFERRNPTAPEHMKIAYTDVMKRIANGRQMVAYTDVINTVPHKKIEFRAKPNNTLFADLVHAQPKRVRFFLGDEPSLNQEVEQWLTLIQGNG